MLQITKDNILKHKNPYLDKLIEHYGDLHNYEDISVLYFVVMGDDEDDLYKCQTAIFMVKYGLKVDFVKVFGMGDHCSLGVDLTIHNTNDIEELKKIVKYGTNFKYWDLDYINIFD